MTLSERWLRLVLRLIGTAAILALVPVFMPREWIVVCHEAVRLGEFPAAPVVEYLARSTSLFYAMVGVVLWVLSMNVRRNGRAITVAGVFMIAGGMTLVSIDVRAGMPTWWTVVEGPWTVLMGLVLLLLQLRAHAERETAAAAAPAAEEPAAEKVEVQAAPPREAWAGPLVREVERPIEATPDREAGLPTPDTDDSGMHPAEEPLPDETEDEPEKPEDPFAKP